MLKKMFSLAGSLLEDARLAKSTAAVSKIPLKKMGSSPAFRAKTFTAPGGVSPLRMAEINREILSTKLDPYWGVSLQTQNIGRGTHARLHRGPISARGRANRLKAVNAFNSPSLPYGTMLGAAAAIGAASFIDKYSEGWYGKEGQAVASVPSFLLKWSGAVSTLKAGTRTIGSLSSQSYLQAGGRVDNLIGKLSPSSVGGMAMDLAERAGGYKVNSLKPFKATYESFRDYKNLGKSVGKDADSQWLHAIHGLSRMKHPFIAPTIAGAGIGGIYGAFNATPAIPDYYKGLWYSQNIGSSMPQEINTENFESGIYDVNPASAIKSRTVMEGQRAITQKMLSSRRI